MMIFFERKVPMRQFFFGVGLLLDLYSAGLIIKKTTPKQYLQIVQIYYQNCFRQTAQYIDLLKQP